MRIGKHSSGAVESVYDAELENPRSKLKIVVIIIVVLLAIAGGLAGVYFGMNLLKNGDNKVPVAVTNTVTPTPAATEDPNAIPNKVGNYNVLGQLVIEKIKLEQYILEKTDDEALKQGLTKLYGNTINKTGNFVIAGHAKEKMFVDLNKLEKDDTFYILDKSKTKVTYKVVDKYLVDPDDLKPLLPNSKEKEVTLITCEDGATKRLVIKAKEVVDNSKKAN